MGRSVTGSVGRRRCCSPSLSCHAMSIAHEITDLRPTSSSLPPPPPPPPPPHLSSKCVDDTRSSIHRRCATSTGLGHYRLRRPARPRPGWICQWGASSPALSLAPSPTHQYPPSPSPPRLVWDHCTTQGQEPAAVCSEPASQSVFAGADGGKPPPPPPARQRLIGCYAHVGSTSGDLHRQ